jgi:hypothetical protein
MPYSIVVAPIFVIVLGTGVFSLKSHDHLALLPFQTYLVVSFKFTDILITISF